MIVHRCDGPPPGSPRDEFQPDQSEDWQSIEATKRRSRNRRIGPPMRHATFSLIAPYRTGVEFGSGVASERPIGRAGGGSLLRSFAFIAARWSRRSAWKLSAALQAQAGAQSRTLRARGAAASVGDRSMAPFLVKPLRLRFAFYLKDLSPEHIEFLFKTRLESGSWRSANFRAISAQSCGRSALSAAGKKMRSSISMCCRSWLMKS